MAQQDLERSSALVCTGDAAAVAEAERTLYGLTGAFPNWAEPFQRLATVKFHQRDYATATLLYQRALEIKPWYARSKSAFMLRYPACFIKPASFVFLHMSIEHRHFGAANGLLMTAQMAGDNAADMVAKGVCMPLPPRGKFLDHSGSGIVNARQYWVSTMVTEMALQRRCVL